VKNKAELAVFTCKVCGKTFNEGRSLGGHVRQAHPTPKPGPQEEKHDTWELEGASASKVLEMWKGGAEPFDILTSLKLHPRFVKEVLKEYDELMLEWKRFKEA
jgi:C2H2-type zinc finger